MTDLDLENRWKSLQAYFLEAKIFFYYPLEFAFCFWRSYLVASLNFTVEVLPLEQTLNHFVMALTFNNKNKKLKKKYISKHYLYVAICILCLSLFQCN